MNININEIPCNPITITDGPYFGQKTLKFTDEDVHKVFNHLIQLPDVQNQWYECMDGSFVIEV